jgi:hypothetical protein
MLEDHSGSLHFYEADALEELRAALRPKSKKTWATSRKQKREKKAAKKEKRAAVREAVMMRALGYCECGCGNYVRETALELDHFWGRARSESVESCWALSKCHHWFKTHNEPSAEYWLKKFAKHCERHGFTDEAARARARLSFIQTRSSLPEAPK